MWEVDRFHDVLASRWVDESSKGYELFDETKQLDTRNSLRTLSSFIMVISTNRWHCAAP